MKRFEGKVAVITGGARGIGEGIARRIVSEGGRVHLFDQLEKELRATAQSIGSMARFQALDIGDEASVQTGLEQVYRQDDRLDIMINSAGIVGPTSTNIAEYETKAFEQIVRVNLTGAFLMTKHSIPYMLKNSYGRILLIASIAGKEGNPGMCGYSSSKAGVIGLVKAIGKEYAETNVTINGLAPAVISTAMNLETDPAQLKYMSDKIPMKRLGTVDEAAALATWIVSEEASFNTGNVFDLTGGRATY